MFHSTPVSESLAWSISFITAFLIYALATLCGADVGTRSTASIIGAVIACSLIGLPINLLAVDILALLIVRPLSCVLLAHVLAAILS